MYYKKYLKRFLDFLLALGVFLLFFPVFILLTVGLFFANKGKPFFVQPRPGKDFKIFHVIKFKTMNDLKNEHGELLTDEKRLTAIGKLVRKSSLDEIPQLLNVIKGEMSLIGPRPLLTDYLPLYNNEQKRRHEVRPGITGWAQVNGRNNIPWKQRFELDVWYVDHYNFLLDLKIFYLTLIKIFKSDDVNQKGQATVEYFKGNNDQKD